MSEILTVQPGNWAVLKNGEIRGPLSIDPDALFPIRDTNKTRGYMCWTLKGYYILGQPSEYDIVSILPTDPITCMDLMLKRIDQLEQHLNDAAQKFDEIFCTPRVTETTNIDQQFDLVIEKASRAASFTHKIIKGK